MSISIEKVKPLDPAALAKERAKTQRQIEAATQKEVNLLEEAKRIGDEYTKLQQRLRTLSEKRRESLDKRDDAISRIEDLTMRLKFLPLVGVEGGVKMAERVSDNHTDAALNDITGTITEMRRTRCSVVFKDGAKRDTDFYWIIPAIEDRGDEMEDTP